MRTDWTDDTRLHVLSLGAGVQSSTMALMAALGLIKPMPVAAIFADTNWEPKRVMEWLDWLEQQLPFPVHRVSAGSAKEAALFKHNPHSTERFSSIPYFTSTGGMGRRQCTKEFKLEPIAKMQRKLLGLAPRERSNGRQLVSWVGISTDEVSRMKPSTNSWAENRWPLLEMNMSRQDCLKWMAEHYPGKVPPKSSCLGCPYHNDEMWRDIRDNSPEEWAEVVEIDRKMREFPGARGPRVQEYMHRSLKPLDEVDLRSAEQAGQTTLFDDECAGICGV